MTKSTIKYFAKILLVGCGIIPLVVSIGAIFISGVQWPVLLPIYAVLYIAAAFFAVKLTASKHYPDSFILRLLPAMLPLVVTLVTWAVCMMVSGGFYGHDAFFAMMLVEIAFFPIVLATNFMGMLSLMFYIPLAYNLAFLVFFAIFERKSESKPPVHKGFVIVCSALMLVSIAVGGYVTFERAKTVLPPSYGFEHGGGYASVDIWEYDIGNENNILPKLGEPSTFMISDVKKIPVLDGAEAAFPVYSAFANACYSQNDGGKVQFTNTIYAFEGLINGRVDIFFGAEPSKAQREMARAVEKTLVLTPIGKEAFVFFVNKNNYINGLTEQEIRDIYSGRVRNWAALSGPDEKITPFQRPENSGSQTIMQKIMGDTPLAAPLKEEYVSGMGGVSENIADYRNYPGAIGYSFRFFTMGMADNSDKIKLLNINGIELSIANIKSGAYPYTVSLYAITVEDNPLDTIQPFLDWMQGKQGQELIEKIGYVTVE